MTVDEAKAALDEANNKIGTLEAELKKHADEKNDAKVTELSKALDVAKATADAAQAEVKKLQDAAPKVGDVVKARVAIIDAARSLHTKPSEVNLDGTERDIMVAALVARDKEFKADGKSDDYIKARFDIAVEQQKKADASTRGAMRASHPEHGGPVVTQVDGGDEIERLFKAYDAAPDGLLKRQRDAWLTADEVKHRDAIFTVPPRRPEVYLDRFDARGMLQRIDAWLKNVVPTRDGRMDSDTTTMFFQRQLLYIMTTPYEFRYPEVKYMDIFPVSYEVPTGARSYAFHMYDELGNADIVDDYSDEAPSADRKGVEIIGKIFPVRSSYSYSIQDIRSAMFGQVPLETMKSVTARRIIERKCDALAAVGSGTRFPGVANWSNGTVSIPSYTLATKAAGGTKWGNLTGGTLTYNATPEEILRDVGGMYTSIKITSKGVFEPDTLVLGTQNTSVINTLRLDQFNQTTVGEYLRSKLPWLKSIFYWPQLDTAGASSKERILMCQRGADIFRWVIPQEFEQFPPEPFNLAFKINCHKRWAEPQMVQPNAFVYADGSV